MCTLSNVHNTNIDSIDLQFWRCDYMAPRPSTFAYLQHSTLHSLCWGGEVPCNLTQVVFDTPGSTSTFGETITTFYESMQLDSGEPNTPGSSNTFPNSIPCVSNYLFVMGNQLTKKERDQVTDLLIKYENVFAFSMKDLGRCKTMQFFIDLTDETPIYRRRHRLSKHEWELVDERCKELHEAGFIQPSSSLRPYLYGTNFTLYI